jgi:hypothetical protein
VRGRGLGFSALLSVLFLSVTAGFAPHTVYLALHESKNDEVSLPVGLGSRVTGLVFRV